MILKTKLKRLKHPVSPFCLIIVSMAAQIRKHGFINSSYDHRSIYDVYKLNCEKSLRFKNIKKDIFIKHFFITIAKFKIFDTEIVSSLSMSFIDKLFDLHY